jgi:integrase
MASLYKVKNIWYVNYCVNGHRFKVSTGTANKKLAQIKLEDIKLKLFKGELGAIVKEKAKTSILDFFRRYRNYLEGNGPVDRHSDLARLGIIQEFLARKGIKYIDSINPSVIEELTTVTLNGKKPKTKKNYIALLKTALNKAVEWDLIDRNPIAKVKPPKIVKTFHFFSKEEIQLLIAEADDILRIGIILLVNTGMRRGELYNLRWRDIDFENNRLRIWPYEGFSPKGKRPRSIPFTSEVAQIIGELFKGRKRGEYVFRPYNGPNTLYRHFSWLVKRLGIKGTLHDLRHTFASHLAMSGVGIPVIKELLGHSDISTTMIYSHLSPDIHTVAIQKLKF